MEKPPITFIPISAIQVRPDRQRKEFNAEKLRDLDTSIQDKGLLQPIGVESDDSGTYYLLYGERRLRSITAFTKNNVTLHFAGEPIPVGTIPALAYPPLTELLRAELEYEENARREDLTWQEKVYALDQIAKLHPELSTKDLGAKFAPVLQTSPASAMITLNRASAIAEHMHIPAVAKARSMHEAYAATLKSKENQFQAILNKRAASAAPRQENVQVQLGDLFTSMAEFPPDTFDMIFADPPYGLDADTAFGKKVETKHNYRDDEEYAKNVAKHIIQESFRITKPRAHLFMFCKPLMFTYLYEASKAMLWAPFPFPIIWRKGPGYAPWGNLGFRLNYEILFWASKGQRGLNYMVENVIDVPSIRDREHGAQKPVSLLRQIIEAATQPGDYILDPCCGSGSTLVAAQQSQRRAMGIEKDPEYYALAQTRLIEDQKNGTADPGTTDVLANL